MTAANTSLPRLVLPVTDDPRTQTDSAKLRTLADWFDMYNPNDHDPEVQRDLRRIARELDSLRATPTPTEPTCQAQIWPSWSDRWVVCGSRIRDGRCDKYRHLAAPVVSTTEPTEPTIEIGGQVMTQAQFDAARHPLLHPATEPTGPDEWRCTEPGCDCSPLAAAAAGDEPTPTDTTAPMLAAGIHARCDHPASLPNISPDTAKCNMAIRGTSFIDAQANLAAHYAEYHGDCGYPEHGLADPACRRDRRARAAGLSGLSQ